MGKLDEMRKRREAQHAQQAGHAPPAAAAADAATADAAEPATSGKCSVCRKTLALQHDGMIGTHQKGLGKYCPGSRKPPG